MSRVWTCVASPRHAGCVPHAQQETNSPKLAPRVEGRKEKHSALPEQSEQIQELKTPEISRVSNVRRSPTIQLDKPMFAGAWICDRIEGNWDEFMIANGHLTVSKGLLPGECMHKLSIAHYCVSAGDVFEMEEGNSAGTTASYSLLVNGIEQVFKRTCGTMFKGVPVWKGQSLCLGLKPVLANQPSPRLMCLRLEGEELVLETTSGTGDVVVRQIFQRAFQRSTSGFIHQVKLERSIECRPASIPNATDLPGDCCVEPCEVATSLPSVPTNGRTIDFTGEWLCMHAEGELDQFQLDSRNWLRKSASGWFQKRSSDASIGTHKQCIAHYKTTSCDVMEVEDYHSGSRTMKNAIRLDASEQDYRMWSGTDVIIKPAWEGDAIVMVYRSYAPGREVLPKSRRFMQGEKMCLEFVSDTGAMCRKIFERIES